MQRFVAVENGEKCLAVFNNCAYSFSYANNSLLLTLLNGSAYAAHPIGDRPLVDENRYIHYIEEGRRTFDFRIAVTDRKNLDSQAQQFVQKPYALNVFPHGEGRRSEDAFTVDNEAISLHAFKRSKKGGYIARLFNNNPSLESCEISVFGVRKKLKFGKFEIKTLKYDGGKLLELKEIEI
jgi:alpha-mannosidase